MTTEIALKASEFDKVSLPPIGVRLQRFIGRVMLLLMITGFLSAAWYVWTDAPYTSDSNIAYNLGLGGGLLMLSVFLYPLRKRLRILRPLGPLRHWLKFHLLAGVLGPLLILFHSTFQVHSLNAGIALGSMLLVVSSGLVGLLLYRRIYRGLNGRRNTLRDLQDSLQQQLELISSAHDLPAEIKEGIEQSALLASATPEGRWQRVAHFLLLGYRRRATARRARRTLKSYEQADKGSGKTQQDLTGILANIDATLRVAQTAAQFATYERLFSYWHTVHIPFLFMLFFTAVVHVIAVHAY